MPYTKPLKARSGARHAIRQRRLSGLAGDGAARPPAGTTSRSGSADARRRPLHRHRLAHGIKGTGRGPFESGVVRVSNTGRVTVYTGAAAIGQGLHTALAQIAASELGLRAG